MMTYIIIPKTDASYLYYMEYEGVICQSCGMPILSSEDYGSDDQGSRSFAYCYRCYSGGKFTDEGVSLEKKMEESLKWAKRLGMEENSARRMLSETLPKLSRWKKVSLKETHLMEC